MILPGIGAAIIAAVSAGGGGSSGSGEQYVVPGFPSPIFVVETSTDDKQYLTAGGHYLNEQGS